MTTTAIRTSNRIRRAPRRYDEEDWTPGANNGLTVGRKTDSWVSGELRDADLERERRMARLEKARAYNKDSPTLQTIYFGQEIAEKRLDAEWAKLAKAEKEVQRMARVANEFSLYAVGRDRELDTRAAELAKMKEDLEVREVELQQAKLDAQFIVPDGQAEEVEDEDEEEEEAVSSDEEDEEDEDTHEELESQYESDLEDEEKDDWSDDKLPEGYYLEPASTPKCDWLGLSLMTVAVVSAHMHPELSQEQWFTPAVNALAVLFMWNQPRIARAFAATLATFVSAIVLVIAIGYSAPYLSEVLKLNRS